MKKIISFLVVVALLISVFSINNLFVFADTESDIIVSGSCGENANYIFYENGTLEIYGQGAMYDYNTSNSPWYSINDSIKTVTIKDGITKVGENSFFCCFNLVNVILGKDVQTIGRFAFMGSDNLKTITIQNNLSKIEYYAFDISAIAFTIYYTGTKEQWNNISIESGNSDLSFAILKENYILHEHSYFVESEISATHYNKGSKTFTCSFCGESYVEYTPPIYEHKYVSKVTSPTCTRQGYTTNTCSICGDSYTNNIIKAKGHKYVSKVTSPTCTRQGYTTNTCSICGDSYTNQQTSTLKHIFNSVFTDKATTNSDGKITNICKTCGCVQYSKIFKIESCKLSTTTYIYDGTPKKPTVTVKDSKGNKLKLNTDYTVKYSNNKKKGTATVNVNFKGNYSGSKKLTFEITTTIPTVKSIKVKSNSYNSIKVSWAKQSQVTGYQIYSSYNKKTWEKVATISNSKTNYINKNLTVGKKYYYKIRAYKKVGKKAYYSKLSKIYNATPKLSKVSITSISASSNKAKIKWKKVSGASGYVIYRATSKNGKYKKITTKSGKTLSYTNNNLKRGKTYYYKIRAYKNVNNNKIYGGYSDLAKTEIKPPEKINVETYMSKEINAPCSQVVINIKNNGNKTLRFYSKNSKLVNFGYDNLKRNLGIYDYDSYLDGYLIPVKHQDVKPGKEIWLLLYVDGYDTYYDDETEIYIECDYDGVKYGCWVNYWTSLEEFKLS